jgi:hypothetical protein
MSLLRKCSGLAGFLFLLAEGSSAHGELIRVRHYYSLTQSSVVYIDADSSAGMFRWEINSNPFLNPKRRL